MTTLKAAHVIWKLTGHPTNEYPPAGGLSDGIDCREGPKVALVTGKRIDGATDPCHYVLDGEYVHTGECLDEFLHREWRAMGNEGHADDIDIEDTWNELVFVGAWTPFSKADIEEDDPDNLECKMCKRGIWLPN